MDGWCKIYDPFGNICICYISLMGEMIRSLKEIQATLSEQFDMSDQSALGLHC